MRPLAGMSSSYCPLTTLIAVFTVGEHPAPSTPKTEWREGLRLILKNRLLIRLLIVDVLLASPIAIMGALTAFFFQFVLESPQLTAIGLLAYFVVSLVGVPLWIFLSRYVPKHRAIAIAALLHSINILSMFRLGPGDGFGMVVYFVLAGIVFGGSTFLLRSMMADITDDDNVKSGTQQTGLIFSLMAMTAKAVPALGVGLTYPLLQLAGFDPSSETVTPEAIQALRYIFILFPSALALLAAILIVNFPLDAARQQQLRQIIDTRKDDTRPAA